MARRALDVQSVFRPQCSWSRYTGPKPQDSLRDRCEFDDLGAFIAQVTSCRHRGIIGFMNPNSLSFSVVGKTGMPKYNTSIAILNSSFHIRFVSFKSFEPAIGALDFGGDDSSTSNGGCG
jgi:hypothetical protein